MMIFLQLIFLWLLSIPSFLMKMKKIILDQWYADRLVFLKQFKIHHRNNVLLRTIVNSHDPPTLFMIVRVYAKHLILSCNVLN